MSLIGAFGGMGDAAVQMGLQNNKNFAEQDLEAQRSTAAQQRAESLARLEMSLKMDAANQQRSDMVSRVNTAAGDIADKGVAGTRALIGSGIADPQSWTPEQQAAVDQSLAADRAAAIADPKVRRQAAEATGDITPKDAMLDSSRTETAALKVESAQKIQEAKTAAYLEVQSARNDAMVAKTQAQYEAAMAKVEAGIAKAGSGNTDFDKKIKLLKESGAGDKEIANFITERKQPSLEDLANGFLRADPNAGSKKQMTPEDAYAKAKALRDITKTMDKTPDPAAPASSEKTTASTKSPYPDGTRLSGPGGKPYVVKNGVPVPE